MFPFGGHTPKVQAIVQEAGYRAAFALGAASIHEGSPRYHLPRAGVLKTTTMTTFAGWFGGVRDTPLADLYVAASR